MPNQYCLPEYQLADLLKTDLLTRIQPNLSRIHQEYIEQILHHLKNDRSTCETVMNRTGVCPGVCHQPNHGAESDIRQCLRGSLQGGPRGLPRSLCRSGPPPHRVRALPDFLPPHPPYVHPHTHACAHTHMHTRPPSAYASQKPWETTIAQLACYLI